MAVNKKAEEVFNKSESELSEMEQMMSKIMDSSKDKPEPVENAAAESVSLPKPPEKKHVLHPMPVITEPEKKTETEETEPFDDGTGTSARKTMVRNEKKAAKALKKNRKSPVIIILVLVILASAAVFAAILQTLRDDGGIGIDNAEIYSGSPSTGSVANENIAIPTPDPEEIIENLDSEAAAPNVVIMSGTGTTVDHSNGQHYMLFQEDTSWRGAMENCEREGGHLVTVTSDEELAEVAAMAEAAGVDRVWIGCHRDGDGNYIWENDETFDIPAEWWGKGEPSMYDSGDNVTEDYLLLWYHDGEWVLNDSRNNPVADYPNMYSGNIAYICEYEQN